MADNRVLKDAAGADFTAATKDVAGVHHQRAQLVFGGVDEAFDVEDTDAGRMPVGGAAIGTPDDVAWPNTGPGSLVALLKNLALQFALGLPFTLSNAEGVKGQFGGISTNPDALINRPADATPYTALDRVASVAGTYPTLDCARVAGGSFEIPRMRLSSNGVGLANVAMRVRLWAGASAPTYSGGDNAAYGAVPGDAVYLGSYSGVFEQFSGKATAILAPDVAPALVNLVSGTAIYWDLQTLDGFTPAASNWFAVVAEVRQD